MTCLKKSYSFYFSVVLILCIGIYYLLSGLIAIELLAKQTDYNQLSGFNYHGVIFYGAWFCIIGALFLASDILFIKRSKHSSIVFSVALINASINIYGEFNSWIITKSLWMFLDWLITSLILFSLFVLWLLTGLVKTRLGLSKENRLAGEGFIAPTAFKFIVCVVISQITFNSLLNIAFNGHVYKINLFVLISFYICSYAALLFITTLFARLTFGSEFVSQFDLTRPSCPAVLISFFGGVIIAVIFLLIDRHSAGRSGLASQFFRFGQIGVRDFNVLVLLTPLPEEIIIRGYFYHSIRHMYSMFISIGFVLLTLFFSHASVMFSSRTAAAAIMSANIMACFLREKTNSLWNCIIFHFVYNLTCVFWNII